VRRTALGRCALLAAVLVGLWGPPALAAKPGQSAAAEALGWRLGDFEAAQRLVIDLSRPVELKTFRLADPWRVVVDMPEIDWRRLDGGAPLHGGAITKVRYGVLKPGTSRLVIDSAEPLRVRNALVLEPRDGHGYRLVVDLEPERLAAAPMAAAPPVSPIVTAPAPFVAAPVPPPIVPPPAAPPAAAQTFPPASKPFPPPVQLATLPSAPPAAPALIAPPLIAPPPVAHTPVGPTGAPLSAPSLPGPSLLPSAQAATPSGGRLETAAVIVPIKPAPPRPAPREPKRVIVIDPGHGGVDPGAISLSGVYEKSITLAIAEEIERQLTMSGRYKVVLTRSDDTFIRLRDRVALARQAQADLFLSIHADSLANHSIGGMSIYTLSETASDREAEALAAKENKADIIAGIDMRGETHQVSTILIDLAQRETKNLSATLARSMIDELGRDRRLLPKPHRFAGFAVLTAPDVPSVLVELGYLSNRTDERELLDTGHRQRVGRGIARALDRYFAGRERPRRS
jgi:N-acetylmuramoyl-L-alanine amidase